MKLLIRVIIFLMYLISYVYAVHMMSIEPDNNLWGYMCVFIFATLAIIGVTLYSKSTRKKNEENL